MQALAADADRGRDRAHPHRGPPLRHDHVAGRIECEFAQPGPPERPGFSSQIHDSHAREFNPDDRIIFNVVFC